MAYSGKTLRNRKVTVTNDAGTIDRAAIAHDDTSTSGFLILDLASAAIPTPTTGYITIFAKESDKKVYLKDSTGTEILLGGLSGVTDSTSIDFTNTAGDVTAVVKLSGSTLAIDASGVKVADLGIANTQISASAAIAYSKLAALTASKALVSDASGVVTASAASSTELGYLAGVTSAIQTQLNTKQASGSYITDLTGHVAATGPGSATSTIQTGVITNTMISASAAIALSKLAALTIDKVLISSGSGVVTTGATTAAEIGYVSGVTSAIQTQLDAKQASGNYITGLTGHVVATGPGSVASTIQSNVITDAMVASGAAIAYSKLAALTADRALVSSAGGVITPSATTSAQIGYLSGTTSDVQNQINGKLSLTGGTLSGALTLAADPSSALHAASKQYVDNLLNGVRWKAPVKAASTANVTVSSAPSTLDGVTLVTNDRVLLKDQTTASQNGIYIFSATASALTRAIDFDAVTPIDEINGAAVVVLNGTANADKGFVETTTVVTVGTDAISFVQFSSVGSIVAGTAIDVTGQTVSAKFDNTSVGVNGSNQLEVKALGITNAHVSASAAIAYSKLALTGSILNADLAGSIADTKLATISTSGKVSNNATTATSANSNSTIVARDGAGGINVGLLSSVAGTGMTTLDGNSTTWFAAAVRNTSGSATARGFLVDSTATAATSYPQVWYTGGVVRSSINGTGAWVLGDANSGKHNLQGAQAGDLQVKVENLSNTGQAHGLGVYTANVASNTIIQAWTSGGVDRGYVFGTGKWTIGATGSTEAHEIRGSFVNIIRPNDTVNSYAGLLNFTNAAGTQLCYIAAGAQTGAGMVSGEINNGLVLKSGNGLVFSGANNRVDGKMSSTGAWTLGDTTSPQHTLQGSQASDYQVKILNSHATLGSGLRVDISNSSASNNLQAWLNSTTTVGFVDGAGRWELGSSTRLGSASSHKIQGSVGVFNGGVAPLTMGHSASGYPMIGFNALPTTTANQYTRSSTDTVHIQTMGQGFDSNSAFEWHSFGSAAGGTTVTLSAGTIVGKASKAGQWELASPGANVAHKIYGAIAKLIRPSDAANQYLTLEFGNAAGTTQAYVGLGANTGTGLFPGEYNNGLGFKSAAGLAFSGVNNRVDGSMDANGKWQLGSVGGTQVHELRGLSTSLIRPSDAVNQASYFQFTNAAGAYQAYVGLGANTGAGLVTGEINNGLVLKSAAGIVFSGVNNRVDSSMDANGQWTLGDITASSTAATAIHKFVRASNGMRVFIPIGATSQSNPTIIEPATAQDNDSMRLSAGETNSVKSWIQLRGNWNGTTQTGGNIDFATSGVVQGQIDISGNWLLGNSAQTAVKNHTAYLGTNGYLRLVGIGTTSTAGITFQNGTGLQNYIQCSGATSASLDFFNASGNRMGMMTQAGGWTFGPTTGFAGAVSHAFNGGIGVSGNIIGTEYAASKLIMDNFNGASRFYSCGLNNATIGSFQFQVNSADASLAIVAGTVSSTGAWNIGPTTPGTTFPGNRVRGVTNGSAASAGDVGEIISATPGTFVNSVTTNIPFTVTSIALTAGDWDVQGTVVFAANGATTTASLWVAAISRTPNDFDTAGFNAVTGFPIVAGTNSVYMPTPTRRVTITGGGTTTVYLTARLTYSAGTPIASAESHISARRAR